MAAGAKTKRGRKGSQPVESPWMDTHRAALYADEEYRTFLERMKSGEVRCVRVGRKYKTRADWVDEWLLSLEDTGMLQAR